MYRNVQIPVRLINLILKYSKGFHRSHTEAIIDGSRKIAKELIRLNYQMVQLAQEKTDENIPEDIKSIDINGVNNSLD